ncbi:hypothetical protein PIB30_100598 [Stylosanthes scabra]|uniref:Uncharacterized protein n=1 Tax=Stylosanthes scabra TaxID=79078 RepID=A0ABU6VYF7_9FABA|nr:hypothetical protein [Stylosanthes scabra]
MAASTPAVAPPWMAVIAYSKIEVVVSGTAATRRPSTAANPWLEATATQNSLSLRGSLSFSLRTSLSFHRRRPLSLSLLVPPLLDNGPGDKDTIFLRTGRFVGAVSHSNLNEIENIKHIVTCWSIAKL